jgi:hypothetical protein
VNLFEDVAQLNKKQWTLDSSVMAHTSAATKDKSAMRRLTAYLNICLNRNPIFPSPVLPEAITTPFIPKTDS